MSLKDKAKNKLGEKIVKDNPFLTSQEFLGLIRAMAIMSRVILINSSGPAEAMNAFQSVMVTFLKNVPNELWDSMREVMNDHSNTNASKLFAHLDGIRNYGASKFDKYVEVNGSIDDWPINTKGPKKPS